MWNDPAKLGFFIWPLAKFMKFHKGKYLRLLSSTTLEFLKLDLYFQNSEHLKYWCFSTRLGQKIWNFAVGPYLDGHTYISENFHSIFDSKVQGSMLNKTRHFFTDDLQTLVDHHYKTTSFSCAFKQYDIWNALRMWRENMHRLPGNVYIRS